MNNKLLTIICFFLISLLLSPHLIGNTSDSSRIFFPSNASKKHIDKKFLPRYDNVEINYSYLGNFKAILSKPKGRGPFPVVVYSYDEFYDWAGPELSNRKEYNLEEIAKFFAKRGYVVVIPLERYRKVNAITGVVHHIRRKPYVKKNKIHLIGLSEGAFMSFLAAYKLTGIASLTCLAPIMINDKGYLSDEKIQLRSPANPRLPILVMEALDTGWRVHSQETVYRFMNSKFTNIRTKQYYQKKRWFWDMNNSYMRDVLLFMNSQYTK